MLQTFKSAYAHILTTFGFNHPNTVAMAQIIRATFAAEGAQAVIEVNREHNTRNRRPERPEPTAKTRTFLVSGPRESANTANFTKPAQSAGSQQEPTSEEASRKPKRGRPSSRREVAAPAAEAEGWPEEPSEDPSEQ